MLLFGLVLPGTKARSGMKAPNGTFMKRLLSISQTEQTGACASAVPLTDATAAEAASDRRKQTNVSVQVSSLLPPLIKDLDVVAGSCKSFGLLSGC